MFEKKCPFNTHSESNRDPERDEQTETNTNFNEQSCAYCRITGFSYSFIGGFDWSQKFYMTM